MADIRALARRLATEGPFKTEPANRLVQILWQGHIIAKTTQALYVWEHPNYPQFYIPRQTLDQTSLTVTDQKLIFDKDEPETYSLGAFRTVIGAQLNFQLGDKSTDDIIAFSDTLTLPAAKPLAGFVRITFAAMDAWFEEDTQIHVHPKDPYKRIDTLTSSREIVVSLHDVVLARSTATVHLHETGLPCRYYFPLVDVEAKFLRPSATRSKCPYKGEAEYYSVEVEGKVYEDLVWYYRSPLLECSAIADRLCFYNEKVDITVDGVKVPRPTTGFS